MRSPKLISVSKFPKDKSETEKSENKFLVSICHPVPCDWLKELIASDRDKSLSPFSVESIIFKRSFVETPKILSVESPSFDVSVFSVSSTLCFMVFNKSVLSDDVADSVSVEFSIVNSPVDNVGISVSSALTETDTKVNIMNKDNK